MDMNAGDRWTTQVSRVLAPNPGLMTLDGTNTLVVRAPGHASAIVIDPGPEDADHLSRLETVGDVELILLTHHHLDHVESAASFAARTGAQVRALEPALCIGAEPLVDGERIRAGGVELDVVATPGHTADSTSFHVVSDEPLPESAGRTSVAGSASGGSMITGDTILGRGTTIIAQPDGSLEAFLATLDRLEAFGPLAVLPAHGPMLPDLVAICVEYREHRLDRLAQMRDLLARLDRPATTDPETIAAIVDGVYGAVHAGVRFAAESSTKAQLEYLAQHG